MNIHRAKSIRRQESRMHYLRAALLGRHTATGALALALYRRALARR